MSRFGKPLVEWVCWVRITAGRLGAFRIEVSSGRTSMAWSAGCHLFDLFRIIDFAGRRRVRDAAVCGTSWPFGPVSLYASVLASVQLVLRKAVWENQRQLAQRRECKHDVANVVVRLTKWPLIGGPVWAGWWNKVCRRRAPSAVLVGSIPWL